MHGRVQQLRRQLAAEDLDALLVSTPENRRYLSGFTGSAGYLIITQEHALIATDFRYFEQVGVQAPDFELVRVTQGDIKQWLPPCLETVQASTLGFEANDLSFALHERLTDALASMAPEQRPAMRATYDLAEGLRIYKDATEMDIIITAIHIADRAFEEVAETLQPGISEREIAWRLERSMRERGAESTSFDIIVASGPNAARPHHRPSDRIINEGEPIIIDMGARVQGYCSDISRTVCLGEADDQFRKVYDLVLASQETAIAAVQAGMSGHDGDHLARNVIEKAGHGDHFGHGTGHGVGLAIHENPRVARNATNELADGMVFTIEPGVYVPGWGGVRIEDIVVLKDGYAQDLTTAHKKELVSV